MGKNEGKKKKKKTRTVLFFVPEYIPFLFPNSDYKFSFCGKGIIKASERE